MKRRALFRLDLTPLIDVVFLLLIFFLVTSIFRKDQTTIPLQLPPVGAAATEVPVRPMQVELSATQLAVGGKGEMVEFLHGNPAWVEVRGKNSKSPKVQGRGALERN